MQSILSENRQLPIFPPEIRVRSETTDNEYRVILDRPQTEINRKPGNEILMELLHNGKSLEIYEYYDGVHLTIDGLSFLLTTPDYDENLVYSLVQAYLSAQLPVLINLEKFSFTTRFPSEINYSSFTVAPEGLKTIQLSTTIGLNPNFLQNVTDLIFENFNVQDYNIFPVILKNLKINTLWIENLFYLESFLLQLRDLDSFEQLIIEEMDSEENYDDRTRLFDEYIPGKWSFV